MSNRGIDGNIFSITCDGTKASELVRREKYDWVDNWFIDTDTLFPISAHTRKTRVIELVEFDYNPYSEKIEKVLDEFARRGLMRPSYEDALTFGITYPEEQKKHSAIFLHEPVTTWRYPYPDVLVLGGSARKRTLYLHWSDLMWYHAKAQGLIFTAVRK